MNFVFLTCNRCTSKLTFNRWAPHSNNDLLKKICMSLKSVLIYFGGNLKVEKGIFLHESG